MQDLALRARIVLRCADGLTNRMVAGEVGACALYRPRLVGHRIEA